MKRPPALRSRVLFALSVVLAAIIVYHGGVVGQVAYAFERGKLKAEADHLSQFDMSAVADLERLSHGFSVVSEHVKPSVVHIRSISSNRKLLKQLPEDVRREMSRGRRTGTGSGLIVDESGYIVTNNHVIEEADVIDVTLHDGRHFRADIVGTDPKTDLAMVKIDAGRLHAARLGDSDQVKVGYIVLAIGSPFRLDHTVSHGIISAVERHDVLDDIEYQGFLQTDAPINPGNSGGPLINTRGEVIGINTAIATESGGHQGVGFAIPSNMVRRVAEALKSGKGVVRGYLGVAIRSVDRQMAETYGLTNSSGVLVSGVQDDGPAGKGGVKQHDIIVAVNGKPTSSSERLQSMIALFDPGTELDVTVWRNDSERHLKVVVATQPNDFSTKGSFEELPRKSEREPSATEENGKEDTGNTEPTADFEINGPFSPFGFSAQTYSKSRAAEYDLDDTVRFGVIVTDVDPTSQAYDGDLRRGLVITEAQGKKIRNERELLQTLEALPSGSAVRVWVQGVEGVGFPVLLRREFGGTATASNAG